MNTIHQNGSELDWKGIYRTGAICTFIVLAGAILDIVIGSVSGGNLLSLPHTAIGRFEQLQEHMWLGLYNLDLLNLVNQLILIPSYVALYVAHRETKKGFALLSLIIFLIGTICLVVNNSALVMLDLSRKYAAAAEAQKMLYAAAGEAMLARGEHGGLNFFIGFFLPNVSGLLISLVMLRAKIFNKCTSYLGIVGSTLMCLYVILVTFVPDIKSMATAFAAPGGFMLMAWMILYARRLFQLGSSLKAQ